MKEQRFGFRAKSSIRRNEGGVQYEKNVVPPRRNLTGDLR